MAKSKSTSFKKQTFSSSHLVITALVFGVVGGIIGWAISHAAPAVKYSGNGTISNPIMVTDLNGDGLPNYGDTVTFKETNTETTDPAVYLACRQNGTLVGEQWVFYNSYTTDRNFTLSNPPLWGSGAADCTAQLQNWDKYSKTGKVTNITSITFHVNA